MKRTGRPARGHLPKAYLRIDPNLDRHPDSEIVAIVRLVCAGNRQDPRGTFKTWGHVVTALGRRAAAAKEHLTENEDGSWSIDHWSIWQEGDLNVGERMRAFRERKRSRIGAVTADVTPAVTEPLPNRISPSEASRRQGVITEQQQPRARLADDFLSDDARAEAIREGGLIIQAITALSGQDPAEVLKRCSMVPAKPGQKPYYLLRLDRSRDEHLLRTVNDLRDELQRLQAQRASQPDLDALDAEADATAEVARG